MIGTLETAADRPEEAIKAFQEVIKRAPRAPVAHLALARLYRARGEWESAATHAQAILADAPKQPDARAELVRIWLGQGQPARAAEELASLRREFPNALGVLTAHSGPATRGRAAGCCASVIRQGAKCRFAATSRLWPGSSASISREADAKKRLRPSKTSLKSVAPSGGPVHHRRPRASGRRPTSVEGRGASQEGD